MDSTRPTSLQLPSFLQGTLTAARRKARAEGRRCARSYQAHGSALRIQAVLRSWDGLRHGRYLFRRLDGFVGLEELLTESCGWAMDAWCPEGGASVRSRLEVASARMAQAQRQDCVDTILRQLPRLLTQVDRRELRHPEVVTDLAAWREHLATLDAARFERISGACPAWVLERLYLWDRALDAK